MCDDSSVDLQFFTYNVIRRYRPYNDIRLRNDLFMIVLASHDVEERERERGKKSDFYNERHADTPIPIIFETHAANNA